MRKRASRAAVVVASFCAGTTQAATLLDEDGTTFELYGNLQFAWSSLELGDGSVDELADNGSTFGVLGEREFGRDLVGYFRYEFEGDADEIKEGVGLDTGDQAFFGVEGGFGDVRIGSWDPLIDDLVQDAVSNNDFFDLTDSNGLIEGDDGVNTQGDQSADREGDKIQYTSPPFAGFSGTVGFQYKGEGEEENVSDSAAVAPYLGVRYVNGPLSVGAVWDSLDNYDGDVTGRTFVAPDGTVLGEFDAGDQIGIAVSYELGTLNLAAKLEHYASGDEDVVPNETRLGLGTRYGYGLGDVYGAYQFVDVDEIDDEEGVSAVDDDTSYNELIVGATYELFDAAYLFAEAATYDRDDDVGNGIAVGAAYSF